MAGHPVDADHPAPGAGADHRAEPEGADGPGDDVSVRPGELVGQRDQRPARRVERVGLRQQGPRHFPGDDPPGQLLHDQLGDVPATVAPRVDDQAVLAHLRAQVTVKVGPALPHHVRDVQVAQPALALLADQRPAAVDPVLVAQPPVVAQRGDGDPAGATGATADRQLDRLARRPDQPWARPGHGIEGLAVHGEQFVARLDGDARRGQRGQRLRIRRLAGQHAAHPPPPGLVWGEVGAEQPDQRRVAAAPLGVVGLQHVRVRRAQLPEYLPQQVREVAGPADPVQ